MFVLIFKGIFFSFCILFVACYAKYCDTQQCVVVAYVEWYWTYCNIDSLHNNVCFHLPKCY